VIVQARTPTRIDLSGGTLDLHPLYLFLEGSVTINAAVDLWSTVRIETREDAEIHLKSIDTGVELAAASLEELALDNELSLVARVVRFYAPPAGVNVTTNNLAPLGSGLGGSSSLIVALAGALDRINATDLQPAQFVDFGSNLGAQVIALPAGKQDYLAALYGGVNAFHFGVGGWSGEQLVRDEGLLCDFEDRIVLTFTGESRFSGTNNWNMMKRFMDDVGDCRATMRTIQKTAAEMREALLTYDVDRFADLLDREWSTRRQLAEGVTTPTIDRMVEASKSAGALASKICGAGGGGCMITVVRKGNRERVEAALESAGASVLGFHIARQGLTVEVVQ